MNNCPKNTKRLLCSLALSLVSIALVSRVSSAADAQIPEPVQAILAASDRTAADRELDARRHPGELLAFTEVQPGMSVLDMGTGAGYTAELLARAVGPSGRVVAQNDPFVFEKFLKGAVPPRFGTPIMSNVQHVVRASDDPFPSGTEPFDLITIIYWYHDTVWLNQDRAKMNKTLFAALRPGGTLVVVDHSGKRGSGATETDTVHRIEESVVRNELRAAGFEFVGDAQFLRNPDDPRDTPFFKATEPVDGFVLKFRKK